ncbi:MAG TPA: heme o synthase [Microbacteriaceae bacterium]|nr:heme o synthase [Microbacteriaceae bacterium]
MTETINETSARPRPSAWQRVRGYVALTKPRIIELLLITTVPVMILAQGGFPDLWLVLATLVGGTLAAGSANAFNMWFDRDIDAVMERTKDRPLVTGVVSVRGAVVFSWILGIVAVAFLWLTTNWVAAVLAAGAIAFYVLLYTMVLKRRTPQNIVWGGIAGCMPVLIGWSAVTGSLSWEALILFGVVFLWTPPHYWPLSMRYREDYRAAGVPMLAVVRSETVVALQSVLYAWATVVCSLLLIPVAPMGIVYTVVAAGAGLWFIIEAHRLYAKAIRGGETRPMRLFHGSISYLALVFVAVGVDPLVYLPL